MNLEKLRTVDFAASVGFRLPPKAMRLALRKLPEFRDLTESLKEGSINERTLQTYVTSLLKHFRQGESFQYDEVLAMIAVVLEGIWTPFAEEYLSQLAALKLVEMPMSIGVANAALEERRKHPTNTICDFAVGRLNSRIIPPVAVAMDPQAPYNSMIETTRAAAA